MSMTDQVEGERPETQPPPQRVTKRLAALGAAVVTALGPAAACSGTKPAPDGFEQNMPICGGEVTKPELVVVPGQKTIRFNAATGLFEGQRLPTMGQVVALAGATTLVFDLEDRTKAGSGFLVNIAMAKAVVTAAHVTGSANKPTDNAAWLVGQSAVPAVWGCATTDGQNGPDASVMFPRLSPGTPNRPLEMAQDGSCRDGEYVLVAGLQSNRDPGQPAVYPGLMTHVDNGECGVITGLVFGQPPEAPDNPTWQIRSGVSGGPIMFGGRVIGLVAAAINLTSGAPQGEVQQWTADQIAQHTGKRLVDAPTNATYALAQVVPGKDLNTMVSAATHNAPECVLAATC